MRILQSKSLFKSLFPAFTSLSLLNLHKIATFCDTKELQIKENQISNVPRKRNLNLYFAIYEKHQSLFQKEGLFNLQSQKINESLSPAELELIKYIRDVYEGNIQLASLSYKETEGLFNISRMLKNRKEINQQYLAIQDEFDNLLVNQLANYVVEENNLKKSVLILNQLKTKGKMHLCQLLEVKINQIIDSCSNIRLLEILLQELLSFNIFNQRIYEVLKKYPVEQILKLNIQIESLPKQYFKSQISLLSDHFEKMLSENNPIGYQRLIKIYELINSYPISRDVINTYISIVQYAFFYTKVTLNSKQALNFIMLLLTNEQTALMLSYFLSERGENVKYSILYDRYMPFSQQSYLNQAIISIILHKNKNKSNENHLKLIDQAISARMSNLPAFLDFYRSIRLHYLPNFLNNFIQIYHKQFKKIKNPFKQQCYSVADKALYMQFFFKCYTYLDKQKFLKFFENHITTSFVYEVVSLHLQQKDSKFIIDKYFIFLLQFTFPTAIAQGNRKLLSLGLRFLIQYQKPGIQRKQDQYTENKVWKLLKRYTVSLQKIIDLQLEESLYAVIRSYIEITYKNYKHDYHYKTMITQLLDKLPLINPNHQILYRIVKEAMKFNLIESKHHFIIKNIQLDQKYLQKQEIMKLQCILGKYIDLTIKFFNPESIEAFIINRKYENVLVQNHDRIMKIIANVKAETSFQLLAAYNLPKCPKNDMILKLLLDNTIKFLGVKIMHQMDAVEIFKNCLKNLHFDMKEYNILWHKYVELLFFRIHTLTFESHIKIIQYIHSQPRDKINKELVAKYIYILRKQSKGKFYIYNSTQIALTHALVLSGLRFRGKHLKDLHTTLGLTNPNYLKLYGISLLLMLQNDFTQSEKYKLIRKLARYESMLRMNDKRCRIIYDLHYHYLKKKQPRLMSSLSLRQQDLQPYLYSKKHPEIYLDLIFDLCKELNCSFTLLKRHNSNKLIRINQTILIFLSPYKNGCIIQQNLIKKMILCLEEGKYVVIIPYYQESTYEVDLLNKIKNESPLLTQDIYQKLMKKIQSKSQQNEAKQNLEQEEEEPLEEDKDEQEAQIQDIKLQQDQQQQCEQQDEQQA